MNSLIPVNLVGSSTSASTSTTASLVSSTSKTTSGPTAGSIEATNFAKMLDLTKSEKNELRKEALRIHQELKELDANANNSNIINPFNRKYSLYLLRMIIM